MEMIVLLGESGSGKSSVMKRFIERYPEFHAVIPYTTRPKRIGEIDGVDYHFVSIEVFEKMRTLGRFEDRFLNAVEYNSWKYGTLVRDYFDDYEHKIAICTPNEFRWLTTLVEVERKSEINSFYIFVPRRDRLIKILQRGDEPDEAYRRNLSEVGQFDGVEGEVYLPIYNPGYERSVDEIVDFIHDNYNIDVNKVKEKHGIE